MRFFSAVLLAFCTFLVTACAIVPSSPVVDLPARATLDAFSLEGRFSLRNENKSYSGRLSWRHDLEGDRVLLSSPLGQGMAEIVSDTEGAHLTASDGQIYSAADTETLTRNVLGYPATAVLPYSQALSRFPAHLQQMDMESNGKSVNRFGEPIDYVTGPLIFGEPGTNGQHSFYRLLHQGTDIVPLQFIGFKDSQIGTDVVIQGSTSQQKLCANVAAQIVAFACGKADDNRNKNFEGGRPSSIIIGEQLTPKTLGALLAHFENKVMFQGFAWNVNSFDQEGVQLGKVLAKRVLAHETDGALKVYSDLLNI